MQSKKLNLTFFNTSHGLLEGIRVVTQTTAQTLKSTGSNLTEKYNSHFDLTVMLLCPSKHVNENDLVKLTNIF